MSERLLKTFRKFADFQAEYEGSIPFTCFEPRLTIPTWLRNKLVDFSLSQLQESGVASPGVEPIVALDRSRRIDYLRRPASRFCSLTRTAFCHAAWRR
jgi:hypothetical protein